MKSHTKQLVVAFSVLASVCITGLAEEPQWPKRNLQFKVQPSPDRPRHPRLEPAVTHMALVDIVPESAVDNLNLGIISSSRDGDPSRLLKTPAGQSMSEKQRQLLSGKTYMVDRFTYSRRDGLTTGPGDQVRLQYRLYAVSEDDARKMAQALVELCDIKGRARLEETRTELDKSRKLISETEKKIAELNAAIKAADTERSELQKTVSYRNLDDALQDVVELDKALRSLQVEIAGIEAKVNAIRKHPAIPDNTEAKARMLANEDIELAGVLARKSAIEGYRKTAQQYCTLARRRSADQNTGQFLAEELSRAHRTATRLEQTLADPPAHMKPLIVLDNEVLIFPVTSATSTAPAPAGPMPRPGPRR